MAKIEMARFGVAEKDFFLIGILLFNTLTWFYLVWTTIVYVLGGLQAATAQSLGTWVVYYISVVASGIFGSILSKKLKILHFFYFWVFLGVSSSLLPIWFNSTDLLNTSTIGLFLGFSFGLGMPAMLASFANLTKIENRGIRGGIIFLAINFGAPLFKTIVDIFDITTVSIISAIWRGFALILFFYLGSSLVTPRMRKTVSFSSIFQDKAFILYFVAWTLFCSVDNFEKLVLGGFLEVEFYSSMLMLEAVIGSIFGFVGGWLCDLTGRKRVVIYGFVVLGLAYAVVSIAPIKTLWYLYFVADGVSLGMLWVAFFFVLWGDLSQHGGREKYYAIGSIPYFLSPLIRVLIAPFVMLPSYFAFSLASFFLFVAVLPLMYAPETLPERKVKLRKLRKYVEKAREVKERSE